MGWLCCCWCGSVCVCGSCVCVDLCISARVVDYDVPDVADVPDVPEVPEDVSVKSLF